MPVVPVLIETHTVTVKIIINHRKIIRTRTIYSRFRIELNFLVKLLDSDLDKFKGVKTGREQTCTLLGNLVLTVMRIINRVSGFEPCTYAL